MSAGRRIELASAAACVALAGLASLYVIFGPTITSSTATSVSVEDPARGEASPPEPVVVTSEHRSLYEDGIETAVVVYIGLMMALAAGVLVLATLRGRFPATRSSAPSWIAASFMLFFALLAALSIGLFFMPAALVALFSAAATSRDSERLRVAPP